MADDEKTMDSIVIERLENACIRAEFEYPSLSAPEGVVAVRVADLRHLLSMPALQGPCEPLDPAAQAFCDELAGTS